jgi:hypothetical protein
MIERNTDLDIRRFFDDLCDHLRDRASTVRSLAIMAAMERWVQFEAAALLDIRRACYGLTGGTSEIPDWWITMESHKVDIWAQNDVAGDKQGVARTRSLARRGQSRSGSR